MRCMVAACYVLFGTALSPVVKDQLLCPETSLISCQPTPRNISEERTPQLHHIGSLESRVQFRTAVRTERNMRPQKGSQ